MGIMKSIYNNNIFGFIGGSQRYIDINLYNIYGEQILPKISDITWKLSRYGEEEIILSKTLANKEIIQNNEVITIILNYSDTCLLHGKFVHQLEIKDKNSKIFFIDLGKILIKELIINEEKINDDENMEVILTIIFDANGGNCEISSYSVVQGSYVIFPNAQKEDYVFIGWYTYKKGGICLGKANDNFLVFKDITLYAQYEPIKYIVSFNSCGGSICKDIEVVYNEPYGILPIPSLENYDFSGWFTQVDSGTQVVSSTKVILKQNHTLYAHWQIATYTVIFKANHGICDINSITVSIGEAIQFPKPIKNGYNFLGWYNNEFYGMDGDYYKPTKNITLYARWSDIEYIVTYDAGRGKCDVKTVIVPVGESIILQEATADGYNFKGWFNEMDILIGQPNDNFTPDRNIKLFAKWSSATVTVKFSPTYANGVCEIKSITVTKGDSITLPNATRPMYILKGWYTSGGFYIGMNNDIYTPKNDIKLYASWKKDPNYFSQVVTVSDTDLTLATRIYTPSDLDKFIEVGNISFTRFEHDYNYNGITGDLYICDYVIDQRFQNKTTYKQDNTPPKSQTYYRPNTNNTILANQYDGSTGDIYMQTSILNLLLSNGINCLQVQLSDCSILRNVFSLSVDDAVSLFNSNTIIHQVWDNSACRWGKTSTDTKITGWWFRRKPLTVNGNTIYVGQAVNHQYYKGQSTGLVSSVASKNHGLRPVFILPTDNRPDNSISNISSSSDYFTFMFIDGTYTITGLTELGMQQTVINFPITFNDKPVTAIDDYAFVMNDTIQECSIPNEINIGIGSFMMCKSLKTVNINCSVIPESAFHGCDTLCNVNLSNNVESVAGFSSCSSLTEIVIPDSVKVINKSAFENSALKEVIIPANVNEIKSYAFASCKNLKSVYIHSLSLTVGDDTFDPYRSDCVVSVYAKTKEVLFAVINANRGNSVRTYYF